MTAGRRIPASLGHRGAGFDGTALARGSSTRGSAHHCRRIGPVAPQCRHVATRQGADVAFTRPRGRRWGHDHSCGARAIETSGGTGRRLRGATIEAGATKTIADAGTAPPRRPDPSGQARSGGSWGRPSVTTRCA